MPNFFQHNFVPAQRVSPQNNDNNWVIVIGEVVRLSIAVGALVGGYYLTKSLLDSVNNFDKVDRMTALNYKKSLAKRLNRPEIEQMEFDSHELKFLADIVGPEEISHGFDDIGGMEEELESVQDNVVLPMQLFFHVQNYGELLSPCPTGVLLYGRPGTGKTLIAKAIAKESGATFINVKSSTLLDKYFGESDRLVTALFKLGRKLAPSIIFIDEIETLLQKRGQNPYSGGGMSSLQGVFLAEWDGLVAQNSGNTLPGSSSGPVVVLGATNRPNDLDEAFLRRMPFKIQTKMPDSKQRLSIIQALVKHEILEDNVDLHYIAMNTEDYSGSDLRELVRLATLQRTKEITLKLRENAQQVLKNESNPSLAPKITTTANSIKNRKLTNEDFLDALSKSKPSASATADYIPDDRVNPIDKILEKFEQGLYTTHSS